MSEAMDEEFSQQVETNRSAPQKQRSLLSIYSHGIGDKKIGIIGYTLIIGIIFSEFFFLALWLLSYFPTTKGFVEQIMGYIT